MGERQKREGTSVPFGGWASPKPDKQEPETRRRRLTRAFWGGGKSSEWVDLDELLGARNRVAPEEE